MERISVQLVAIALSTALLAGASLAQAAAAAELLGDGSGALRAGAFQAGALRAGAPRTAKMEGLDAGNVERLVMSPLPRLFERVSAARPVLAKSDRQAGADAAPSSDASAKSPRRALLYSAVLPGAGEFYAGAKRRAALFFGLELAAWTLWSSWNGEGNDIEDEFRVTADENWDPLDYIEWRQSTVSRHSSITHSFPCSTYVESATLGDCPGSEKQQYYELIGKYDQFVSGWSDVSDSLGNTVQAGEIDSVENFHSDLRVAYEDRRNDSNKLLKRATNIAGLILVNHVLSAIDAARAARSTTPARRAEASAMSRTRLAFVLSEHRLDGTPMFVAYRNFY